MGNMSLMSVRDSEICGRGLDESHGRGLDKLDECRLSENNLDECMRE